MTLALHGGKPVRALPMPARPQYGIAEYNAANDVVHKGNLSGFLAEPGEAFLGGQQIRDLEAAWCEKFGVKHAVAMNSGTSCLFAAVQALGIGPGDEVIVTPWSMSASATCVLAAGAMPVFADVEPKTHCLDPCAVERAVTSRTKAIVYVDLFGSVPDGLHQIEDVAERRNMSLVEDAAQAIGAMIYERPAGTCGDVGVFSLNRHKTLQCGEGGVAVTNDDDLVEGLRRYRNHGEMLDSSVGGSVVPFGGNYRMGEIEAAIAKVQLGRLEELTFPRRCNAERLDVALVELRGLKPPPPAADGRVHVYYLYAVRVPGSAQRWAEALTAEGVPASTYVKPLHKLPLFWVPYTRLPEAQKAYEEVIVIPHVHAGMRDEDIDDVIGAFRKVWKYREEL